MVLAKLVAPMLLALALSADPFSFQYAGQTSGNGKAYLTVRANQPMTGVEAVIKGDGQTIRKRLPDMKAGQSHKITWKQKSAQARYQLEIHGDGVEANFAFEIARAAPSGKVGKLQPMSSREDVVERRQATYKTSFPLTSYEYKIYDTDGDVIASDLVTEKVAPGGTFTLEWSDPAEVFMIFVRGEDQFGRFTEYKLVPWSAEIPHTEVNFDSGKFDIKEDEAPKLDEAVAVAFHELVALDKVNKAVNANITPMLFIVGYTDTVGPAGKNQKLSLDRARAIAEYFRDAGFWAEIYYAGMGERGLRVETADSVDEVRNRRALYLIGVQKPAGGGQIPSSWKKLVGRRSMPPGFELPPLPEKWKDYREKRRSGGGGGTGDGVDTSLPGGGDDGAIGGAGGSDIGGGDDTESYGDELGAGDEGPPPVEGEPGATKKGCSIDAPGEPALGLFVLAALAMVRRRSVAPASRPR